MKRPAFILCIGAALLLGTGLRAQTSKLIPTPTATPSATPVTSDDNSTTARSKALELAGAFTNDGFKIRDGYYSADIEAVKPQIIQVNLYSGNQYWFCVGTYPAKKISITIYDENGKKVDSESYEDSGMAAAGITAASSGRYFVEVSLEEGQKTAYSFLYTYK